MENPQPGLVERRRDDRRQSYRRSDMERRVVDDRRDYESERRNAARRTLPERRLQPDRRTRGEDRRQGERPWWLPRRSR